MKNKTSSAILTVGLIVGYISSYIELPQTETHVGVSRDSRWSNVVSQHLVKFPTCACCGGTKNRQVHHIKPFHDNPELELDFNNLITLCTDGPCNLNCHFVIGHLGNTKCHNPNVRQDAAYMRQRFLSRKCD